MMKLKYILSLVLLLMTAVTNAQQKKTVQSNLSKQPAVNDQIKSLQVGDKVPDIVIAKIINDQVRTARIADFKNQLLILDFWDTYCGSCIETLPKLDAMQRKFGDKIKILAVTYQKEGLVVDFFNKNRFLKGLKPACVVEDDILRAYFKHKIISHEVWIHNGVVKAITNPEYVNEKNIEAILKGEHVDWPVKNDSYDFDPKRRLFSLNESGLYAKSNRFQEVSGITGYRAGIDYRRGIAFDDDTLKHDYRISFYNKSIVDAYKALLFQSDTVKRSFILTPGRIILQVKDPSKYIYNSELGLKDAWDRENMFCYEMLSTQLLKKTERIKRVIQDLNFKLDLNARWEKRKVNCIVIYKANPAIDPDTVSIPKVPAMKIIFSAIPLIAFDMSQQYPPAIDESGYKESIYLLPMNGEKDTLRKQLQRYGFDYKEAEREIEVMVISEQ
ncbi:redoxin domain-containing protein [Pedobacter gandavensis]|uniref:TlpA family protein disulfide reductase n=1 Tax=Pedobacter gandavensis TaxID=2679963 RepID=UPI0024789E88|nr:redoxin domain-containing protein [Pedobacter gandavensis]WGQ11542.1 redoxin domain-containing protein [Pedobacter gandavensis]